MTKGYITIEDLVELGKCYVESKEGFTKWIAYDQIGDVKDDFDGRYVVSIEKIAEIRHIANKNIILWYKSKQVELTNTYVGGWYNEEKNLYEIEEVEIYHSLVQALDLAVKNKQTYIYDLNDKKVISVNDSLKLKDLKVTLTRISVALTDLQNAWIKTYDPTIKNLLSDEWNKLVIIQKRIRKRIVLLESQGEVA